VRGFHWERGKRARTAVVPAAAYLPATLEGRTDGGAKAAASTPSIAWIETRYGNVLRRPDATASDPGGVGASLLRFVRSLGPGEARKLKRLATDAKHRRTWIRH
jgi:hypothetical protein